MRYIVFICLFLHVSVFAETLALEQFKANVFSKSDKKPVEVSVSLVFEGSDIKKNEHKAIDALNIVIGSYYAEDLVMSKGKELLKSTLISYAKKTHALVIDAVYIKELSIKTNSTTQEIIDAIKKEALFQQKSTPKPATQPQQQPTTNGFQPLNLAPPLPKRSLIPDDNAVNF
ncbi:MAG: flagellar basal body-associated FliL family protein [Campylobacterales bacterium]|nr:flagellar basal body-associated FliL family protein [Campylobacterales bacterium]MBN2833322.1 flagellar basal body-associated FliL family protein [Campylobacterales bacterium]